MLWMKWLKPLFRCLFIPVYELLPKSGSSHIFKIMQKKSILSIRKQITLLVYARAPCPTAVRGWLTIWIVTASRWPED